MEEMFETTRTRLRQLRQRVWRPQDPKKSTETASKQNEGSAVQTETELVEPGTEPVELKTELLEPETEPVGKREDNVGAAFETTVNLQRPEYVISLPKGWARVMVAAIEASLFTWALGAGLTLVAFLLTANNSWVLSVDWNTAMSTGADIVALGYLSPLRFAGVNLSFYPLGLTLLFILMGVVGVRYSNAISSRVSALFIPFYTVTSAVVAFFAAQHAQVWRVALGAALVATIAWAWTARKSLRSLRSPRSKLLVRALRDSAIALGATTLLGLGLVLYATVASWSQIEDISALLGAAGWDQVFVWLAQILYVPNAIAAALSWLAGPGFVTSVGAVHAPSKVVSAPIPAIPWLGAVPHGTVTAWVVAVLIVLGLVLGLVHVWKRRESSLGAHATRLAVGLGVYAAVMFAWMYASNGALWNGQMADFGPRSLLGALFVTLEVGGVGAAVSLLLHPVCLALYRRGAQAAAASLSVGSSNLKHEVRARVQARRAKSAPRSETTAAPQETNSPSEQEGPPSPDPQDRDAASAEPGSKKVPEARFEQTREPATKQTREPATKQTRELELGSEGGLEELGEQRDEQKGKADQPAGSENNQAGEVQAAAPESDQTEEDQPEARESDNTGETQAAAPESDQTEEDQPEARESDQLGEA
ncbi:DUF6350 family protein [Gleimia hominis]|uniref:DUF6350 family protein n=1 Tax=Gleimia hominis TaxID=595468 RepID=A0ABU3ID27_9ACTO|nr:DUF6350 family protein [Gleimia hominis]MDT3767871.1 DUF6350 family protein [Gleimia hominis]